MVARAQQVLGMPFLMFLHRWQITLLPENYARTVAEVFTFSHLLKGTYMAAC
jgi:hypothetical protein